MLKALSAWVEDRTGLVSKTEQVMTHPVPRDAGWLYVFGTATLTSFIVLVATGTALATGYTPAPNDAYHSLQWLSHGAVLGRELRGMHYFAASSMMLFIGIHVFRVFLMGSYKYPREVNWLMGVLLFFLTLVMAFTGQLLRWDQNAIWSIAVAAEQAGRTPIIGDGLARFILGGNTIGGQTLSRFFAFHVFFVPGLIFLALAVHLYLVLQNGISEPPKAGKPVDPKTYKASYQELLKHEGVPFWPNAMWRDTVFSAALVLVIVALAVIFGAPELTPAGPDPTIIQALPQPDWYFLWYFAALAVIPKDSADYIMIGGPLLLGVLMIVLPFVANKGERSPLRRPWSIGVVIGVVLIISTLLYASYQSAWVPKFDAKPLPLKVVGADHGPVYAGAKLFYSQDCIYCHMISGYGGIRGPNLSNIANEYTPTDMTIRILNGATNMPAYGSILDPTQVRDIVAFLETRKTHP